jgi:hypothetical protein
VFSGPAFHYPCTSFDCISISSTGTSLGAFVGGGGPSDFVGEWDATLDFFLPADALNVAYSYASVGVDDRATLFLDSVHLGTFYIHGPQISGTITNASSFVSRLRQPRESRDRSPTDRSREGPCPIG